MDQLHEEVATLRAEHATLSAQVSKELDRLSAYRKEFVALRRSMEERSEDTPPPLGSAEEPVGSSDRHGQLAAFYAGFEEMFRGSREDIRERLRVYLPDVLELPDSGPVLDLGSGRGEWLELLANNGVRSYGVDTSRPFVQDCRDRGLHVVHADALEHMRAVTHGSLCAVTGFHIAEHLPFALLIELVEVSLLALSQGGILILETPNPENLRIGAADFYLDPTHLRPIPPALLEYVLWSRGFVDVEVRRLHPARPTPISLPASEAVTAELRQLIEDMNWAMRGPKDYAVIGRKPAAAPEDEEV